MGFLNKKPIIKAEGFHPIDLNEDNVQAIFNRCLATKDSVDFIGVHYLLKKLVFQKIQSKSSLIERKF